MKIAMDVDVPDFNNCVAAYQFGLYNVVPELRTTYAWVKRGDSEPALSLHEAAAYGVSTGIVIPAPNNSELREMLRQLCVDWWLVVNDDEALGQVASIAQTTHDQVHFVLREVVTTTVENAYLRLLVSASCFPQIRKRTNVRNGLANYPWSTDYVVVWNYGFLEEVIAEYRDDQKHCRVLTRMDSMCDQIPGWPDVNADQFCNWCMENEVRYLPIVRTSYYMKPC